MIIAKAIQGQKIKTITIKICKLGDPMFTKASDQVLQRNEELIDFLFLLGNPICVGACDPCPVEDVYHEEFDKLCTT